jgi:hypothetical protein
LLNAWSGKFTTKIKIIKKEILSLPLLLDTEIRISFTEFFNSSITKGVCIIN